MKLKLAEVFNVKCLAQKTMNSSYNYNMLEDSLDFHKTA